MDEVELFFANFQILGPLGCQGWVVIPQNVKKSKSLHPNVHLYNFTYLRTLFLPYKTGKNLEKNEKGSKAFG